MVGPRQQVGGNDFVVPMFLQPAAPERKQKSLLAKADEHEVLRIGRIHPHDPSQLLSEKPLKRKQLVRIIT